MRYTSFAALTAPGASWVPKAASPFALIGHPFPLDQSRAANAGEPWAAPPPSRKLTGTGLDHEARARRVESAGMREQMSF